MNEQHKLVGMIVPSVDNSFFSALASETERVLSELGYHTLIINSANDAEKERSYMKELVELKVSGIICVSGLSELSQGILPEDFPIVWVDRVPGSEHSIPWVANDDADAMERAVDHLIEKGCRNILLLPGFMAEKQESPRVIGYRKALENHEIAYREEYILHRAGRWSTEVEAGELVKNAVADGIAVDGVITSSDRAAFGVTRALQSIGYFVPEDVRLVSFDNSPYSAMASPSITALDRKADVLAKEACRILMKLMDGNGAVRIENVVPVALERRDSTR